MKNHVIIKIPRRITSKIKEFEKSEWHLADIEHYGHDRNFVKRRFKFVATNRAGEVLGALDLVTEANVGFIEGLLVSSAHRRQGVGQKLMQKAEEIARQFKCNKIWVETDKGWVAEKFYKKIGYNITGTHGRHYLNRKGLIFTKYL